MTTYARCETDQDYADAAQFLLAHKLDLHPSLTTLDILPMFYHYVTNGYLIIVRGDDGQTVSVCAYYHGSPEHAFEDKETALIDVAVTARAHRGTRLFLRGLAYTMRSIASTHPEVKEVRFAALADNEYICRLYRKFAESSHIRKGDVGEEIVFRSSIDNIIAFLAKYDAV